MVPDRLRRGPAELVPRTRGHGREAVHGRRLRRQHPLQQPAVLRPRGPALDRQGLHVLPQVLRQRMRPRREDLRRRRLRRADADAVSREVITCLANK